MIDVLSVAHFGMLRGAGTTSPGIATFFAHEGFVPAGIGELVFDHMHVVQLSNETTEIADLVSEHMHIVSLSEEEVEL